MAVSLKHAFTSAVPDGGDTSLVQPSNWNAEHNLTMGTGALLGRTTAGTGAAEEITAGTGLTLSAGSLAVSVTTPQTNTSNTFTANQIIEVTDNTNAAMRITQLGTGLAIRVEDSANPDATPFIVDASGKVAIGATTAAENLNIVSDGRNFLTLTRASTDVTQSVIQFRKARGTNASPTIVSSGDAVGEFQYAGYNGSTYQQLAGISATIEGTPSLTSMAGRIVFGTTPDGSNTPAERFRINNAGAFGIGGANFGTSGQTIISAGSSTAPSWGTLGVAGGGTGSTTAAGAINALTGGLTITSAAGTTTLTNTSARNIVVTGTLAQTIQLPDVTTLAIGWEFNIQNGSSGVVTVQSSGANAFSPTIQAGHAARFVCIAITGTSTASWQQTYYGSSNRTGSGNQVYASSPTLTTPNLGTPSAVTLTNGTGLPLTTGVTGTLPVANGGTGATTLTGYVKGSGTSALTASATIPNTDITGLGTMSTQAASSVAITGGSITGITDLAVADGGTGLSSATAYALLAGGTTSTGAFQSLGTGTAGQVLTSNGASALPTWAAGPATPTLTSYTSGSGNWTIPSSGTFALVRAWGGGGSGGRGGATATNAGGGGGGGFSERLYRISDLGIAGGTVAYSVGAGGTAVSAAGAGNPGGNSTFSSGATLLTAYGGGPGLGNVSTAGSNFGGGGGGALGAGANNSAGLLGGGASEGTATTTWGGGGGATAAATGAGSAYLGGGGGGGASGATLRNAGTSALAGAGGAASNNGTAATSGTAPAGGGGGQSANAGASGAGGAGRIEIWVW